jgi:hypothetical protein
MKQTSTVECVFGRVGQILEYFDHFVLSRNTFCWVIMETTKRPRFDYPSAVVRRSLVTIS